MIFKTVVVKGKRRTMIIKANSNESANNDALNNAVLVVLGPGYEIKEGK
ncbi:hypothetical protein [Clostridium sp. Ade.TY]|nr:hypothetical protein [Clostridium sp. Ade.TY]